MQKNNSNLSFENILGVISVIMAAHYFLSYRWFYGMLKIWGIENLSIITMEDLTFSFVHFNITILLLSATGFLWIFLWSFISSNKSDPVKDLKEMLKFLKDYWKERSKPIKIIIPITTLIIILIYIFIFKPNLKFPNNSLEVIYFIILTVPPILYIFIKEKRILILGFQILLMFSWANLFLNIVLENVSEKPMLLKNKSILRFEYKNKTITTSDSLEFLFHSKKYIILRDTNGNIKLYDTKNIDKIELKRNSNDE